MNGLGLLPGQAGLKGDKELGRRCLNGGRKDKTEIERRGKEERCGGASSAAAEPGGGVSAVGKRKSECVCSLRLLLPHLGYFLNVTHFTIKVRFVSV